MPITRETVGNAKDGSPIDRYTLSNANGVQVSILTYGGTLAQFLAPDSQGNLGDILLGFDSVDGFLGAHPFFGVLVGRYGNRIAGARFSLEGQEYTLAQNNGPNHLHGGPGGFHQVVWKASVDEANNALHLSHHSPDGEEGYPGNLDLSVVYSLSEANELKIDYSATTDKTTVLNLTNHAYFNLAGSGSILEHQAQLFASRFIPIDETLIPVGELRAVKGTPMDFTSPSAIGAQIAADDEQIKIAGGYDHCWVIDGEPGELRIAARVSDPASGRVLETWTTQPGVQFYTSNFLDGSLSGKGGQSYGKHAGFCLETQHFPDSPNQPTFPSTVLRPGETYRETTIYRVSVAD
jgi:aldose 1-epimerase